MKEHRLFTRYRVQGEVLVQFKATKAETIRADLVDMSFRGFGVYAATAIETNTAVNFFITGKLFEKHLRGQGKVIYVQVYRRNDADVFRIGIEFIAVDSDYVRDILTILEKESAAILPNNTKKV